jgi:energy-coupling factor transporter ATP-binding protein EcfA2
MKFVIKNFQSIASLNLEVSEGSFVVVNGHSSSGKSAFRRAVSALFYNDWDKAFVKRGQKETELSFKEGGLSLGIKKPENTYVFNGVEHKKIGADMPEGLREELRSKGIFKFAVADDEYDIIIDSQLGTMFFVEDSESVGSKILSRVFDVDRYAVALQLLQKDIYNVKVGITEREKKISELGDQEAQVDKRIDILRRIVSTEEKVEAIRLFCSLDNKLSLQGKQGQVVLLQLFDDISYCVSNLLGVKDGLDRQRGMLERYQELLGSLGLIDEYGRLMEDACEKRALSLKKQGLWLIISVLQGIYIRERELLLKQRILVLGNYLLLEGWGSDVEAYRDKLTLERDALKRELPPLCPVCGKPME